MPGCVSGELSSLPLQEAALLLAVGVVLHGLSGCGHVGAHSLAESVGGKWLQELDTLTGSTEVRGREGGREGVNE